jgi:hypothetical protein
MTRVAPASAPPGTVSGPPRPAAPPRTGRPGPSPPATPGARPPSAARPRLPATDAAGPAPARRPARPPRTARPPGAGNPSPARHPAPRGGPQASVHIFGNSHSSRVIASTCFHWQRHAGRANGSNPRRSSGDTPRRFGSSAPFARRHAVDGTGRKRHAGLVGRLRERERERELAAVEVLLERRCSNNSASSQHRHPQAEPLAADGGGSLCARVRVVVAVPGHCVRLRHCGGQLAVAYLYGQLGDRRDLGYLERRSAGDRGLGGGHILIAEVRE